MYVPPFNGITDEVGSMRDSVRRQKRWETGTNPEFWPAK